MPSVTVGVFTLNYTLFTNAQPGNDVQFGMDFSVTSSVGRPLTQVIFPATAVGTNHAGQWNVDNHLAAGSIESLIFANAAHGTITDTPRELAKRNVAAARTKFAVFLVDVGTGTVQSNGIAFAYSITPSAAAPQTAFDGVQAQVITNEQKAVLVQRFANVKFT